LADAARHHGPGRKTRTCAVEDTGPAWTIVAAEDLRDHDRTRRSLDETRQKPRVVQLATTPLGAFPLVDYLSATSEIVGEGLTRLARYLRLAEARSVPCLREDEDPIRVLLEGCDSPSAEFTVTLNLLHFREETEDWFRASLRKLPPQAG
jgi:hypothetical protein